MTEKLVSNEELRLGIKAGIDKLANTVKETLGPMGKTVVIKNAFEEITITKDGVSVAREIYLEEPIESIGAELVKNVSIKANNLAGDGTTTATVLAQAMYNEGVKQLSLGNKPLEFVKGMKAATKDVLKYIKGKKKSVEINSKTLKSVALISSNGEEAIAKTITDVYKKLGENAVISTMQGNGVETEVNIVKGMQFDRGFMSSYCVTDEVKMKAVFENPFIFLYDGKISSFAKLLPAVEYAGTKGRPIIIIAENVQESALRGLVMNHVSGNVQSAIVQSPGYGKKRIERLKDMAVLFGGKLIDKDYDMNQFDVDDLGEVEKAEITATDTALIGGKGKQEEIDLRIKHIKAKIEHFKGNKYETDILESRLGKLTGGVAVIKVGAISQEEGKELLDRVEDCKYAVKAALEEGIVEGGGIALYKASNYVLFNNSGGTNSFINGYNALLKSIKIPFRQILINAEEIPEVIESDFDIKYQGYDVKRGVYVEDMFKAGIIDPFKVVRIALESATSIVGTLLTSSSAVINKADTTVQTFR